MEIVLVVMQHLDSLLDHTKISSATVRCTTVQQKETKSSVLYIVSSLLQEFLCVYEVADYLWSLCLDLGASKTDSKFSNQQQRIE